MIWKKNVYDYLTGCAALCDEFATECSRSEDIEILYRSILLCLDCADLCRQVSMLYVRGSENTRLLAKVCIEVCEKCAQEVSQFDTVRCQQVYALCRQSIRSCVTLLDMAYQTEVESENPTTTAASLFYGINLHETMYN